MDDSGDVLLLRQYVSDFMLISSVLGAAWLMCWALLVPIYRRCPLRRVLLLAALQGAFAIAHSLEIPSARAAKAALHTVVCWLRWAINAYVGVMGVDEARKALARAREVKRDSGLSPGEGDGGPIDPEVRLDSSVDIGIHVHAAVAVVMGGVITLCVVRSRSTDGCGPFHLAAVLLQCCCSAAAVLL